MYLVGSSQPAKRGGPTESGHAHALFPLRFPFAVLDEVHFGQASLLQARLPFGFIFRRFRKLLSETSQLCQEQFPVRYNQKSSKSICDSFPLTHFISFFQGHCQFNVEASPPASCIISFWIEISSMG
jgi:hypothetical protein